MASGERLMGGGSTWGPVGRGSNVKFGQVLDNRERSTQLQYCPLCGGQNWGEVKTRTAPPPVEIQINRRLQAQQATQQAQQAQNQPWWVQAIQQGWTPPQGWSPPS